MYFIPCVIDAHLVSLNPSWNLSFITARTRNRSLMMQFDMISNWNICTLICFIFEFFFRCKMTCRSITQANQTASQGCAQRPVRILPAAIVCNFWHLLEKAKALVKGRSPSGENWIESSISYTVYIRNKMCKNIVLRFC